MRILLAIPLLLATAPPLVRPARAQARFDVVLTVQQNGREIGREEYSLSRAGARAGGSTLTADAHYPGAGLRIEATLERTADLGIAKFELDVQGPEGNLVILAAGSGARLIVRSITKGSEAGREMPGGRDVVLLDDAVYSLYGAVADLASASGAHLTAVFPRTRRVADFVARREPGGDADAVRTRLTGDITGTIVTDALGRVQRVELPAAGIVASRATK
ncbi:MAG TPA: hypothetical protein VFW66_14690 [Gemmatimonadales bacterium]|nr:hypothetical protein [Gemmatimonadales bacterium]